MEQKFKAGDKVKVSISGPNSSYEDFVQYDGKYGEVVGCYSGNVLVSFGSFIFGGLCPNMFSPDQLVLVKPAELHNSATPFYTTPASEGVAVQSSSELPLINTTKLLTNIKLD